MVCNWKSNQKESNWTGFFARSSPQVDNLHPNKNVHAHLDFLFFLVNYKLHLLILSKIEFNNVTFDLFISVLSVPKEHSFSIFLNFQNDVSFRKTTGTNLDRITKLNKGKTYNSEINKSKVI